MTPQQLKKRLKKGKTPAARSIGNDMPRKGTLKTFREGNTYWIQVDKKGKRYKCGLPDYNEDAKKIF